MSRQSVFKLFVILFISYFINFCSNPVKVADNSNNNSNNTIVLKDAWIGDKVDIDGDGYASTANLYFDISSTKATTVYALIGKRDNASEDPTYYIYKETDSFNVDEQTTVHYPLGDEGYEVPYGRYDLTIQIFDQNDAQATTILTSISAEDTDNLLGIYMEEPSDDLITLVFNNECPTDIIANITGYGSITIAGESTNTYGFSSNPGTITFNAYTQIPVGGNLQWTNRTVDFTGKGSVTYRLWYDDSFFYATVKNTGGSTMTDFYVNYQLDSPDYVNVSIPNDGITRPFGYYEAYSNTQIIFWSVGAQDWYGWSNINFPGGDNQTINLTSSVPKMPGDFKPSKIKNIRQYIEAP